MEGKPSGFDRTSLGFLALLSPGPEWVTGCPESESDRTPLARKLERQFSIFPQREGYSTRSSLTRGISPEKWKTSQKSSGSAMASLI